MVDASSSGRAAPKIKSIDVRANLLSQRLAERLKMFQAVRARLYLIAAIVLAGSLLLPWLYGIQARASQSAAGLIAERTKLQKTLDELQVKADQIEPELKRQQMIAKCVARSTVFIGEFIKVMNAVSPELAMNNLKGEVVGGELKLSTRADAETFAAVENYVRSASQGAAPKDAGITSTKRSDTLRKGGINFEFTKKVQIGG